jgi:pimeloyl-ACP methyl ester carboxylesterase
MGERLRNRSLVACLLLALALAACSDDESASTEDSVDDSTGTSSATSEPSSSTAPPTTAFTSERYIDPTSWVCRPDIPDDPCTTDLDVTTLNEDGSTEVVAHEVAAEPAFDCFYLYPTVNISAEGVAGFDGEYGIEIGITRTQAARFSRVCRVFAPLYRQSTFGSGPEVDREAIRAQAYADVEEAFRHYLANDNDGRPFVVMGHSQGSGLATQLLQDHVDGDEELRSRLVSALLIGTVITAPEGEDVGGDFENLPACRSAEQTACVVTYASFDVNDPPSADAGFGSPREGGEGAALCTNPAALEGGPASLQMIDPTGNDPVAELGAPVETPYVALPDFVTGECVSDDGRVYLAITVNGQDGPRTNDLRSDTSLPWGLHPIDYNLALGDLVDLVETQAGALTSE